MKKRIAALFVSAAVAVMSVVPVFAGPAEEFAAANAAQSQRLSDMAAYQASLEGFRSGQVATGVVQQAAGQAAAAAGQAQLQAFQYGQLAKGEYEKAEGLAAYAAYQAAYGAREAGILAQQAANEAERAQLQQQISAYLNSF